MSAEWVMAVAIELGSDIEEAAYDRWYDERHLPLILGCPGFESGTRYTEERPAGSTEPRRDLTLYELSGPEALASADFASRRGFEQFAEDVSFSTRLYRRRAAR